MDFKVINNIKCLGIDMINEANSGHPGIVLSSAPIIYTLYKNHLNINPKDPNWINRDRFVLSAGHGSALLYSNLFMSGYDITLDDLRNFRKIGSITPGHPEYKVTPGVDFTTGPLGQGIASSVGMAIAEKYLNSYYKIIDHKIYCLCGDGDLEEGISYEAMSIAGNLKLNNLIVLYDSNNISLDGNINKAFSDDIRLRCETFNWNYLVVKNGNNVLDIDKAIICAKGSSKPTLIEVKTILGNGSLLENTNKVHGSPLSKEDIINLKNKLGIRNIPFTPSDESVIHYRDSINKRILPVYNKWMDKYIIYKEEANAEVKRELNLLEGKELNIHLKEVDNNLSLREISGLVLNNISEYFNLFIGGSADLSSSTKTYLKNGKDFSSSNYKGKNIWFGVREHVMGSILNGISTYNIRCFGSTFMVFSDYLKPAIRLSSIMNLPVTYVFTHDSINIGEDGITHEPIEQLGNLRSIPNLRVYRPSSMEEIVGCYDSILNSNKPSAIVLSRYKSNPKNTYKNKTLYGGYILKREKKDLECVVISSGNDIEVVSNICNDIDNVRVVSMPCMELFLSQEDSYKESIIPKDSKIVYVEASNCTKLSKYYKNIEYINLDKFGASGSKEDVLKYMEFDINSIKNKIDKVLTNN